MDVSLQDLQGCLRVCKLWNYIITSQQFWRSKCVKQYWVECCYGNDGSVQLPCVFPTWYDYFFKLSDVDLRSKMTQVKVVTKLKSWYKNETNPSIDVFLVGDSGVGKTALFTRLLGLVDQHFCYKTTNAKLHPTSGVAFYTYGAQEPSKRTDETLPNIRCTVWDNSGSSSARGILSSYRRGHCFAVFYDITSYRSFLNVPNWLNHIRNTCSSTVPILIVGTKMDLFEQRQVTWMEGASFAESQGLSFIECTAKDMLNVDVIASYLATSGYDFQRNIV